MLDEASIQGIAKSAIHGLVVSGGLARVVTRPAIDSQGEDALRVILVLDDVAVRKITGDQALMILNDIQRAFVTANDARFPIIEYATKEEFAEEESAERERIEDTPTDEDIEEDTIPILA